MKEKIKIFELHRIKKEAKQSYFVFFLFVFQTLIFLIPMLTTSAFAHEVRPAYLELRQIESDVYDMLWKVPGRGENMRLAIDVVLPERCSNLKEQLRSFIREAYIERKQIQCRGGLTGSTIHIDGLTTTMTDVFVRLVQLNGTKQITRLTPTSPSYFIESASNRWQVSATYFRLGTEHILISIDHLLFVLALLILVKGMRRLVATVTAFTLAHSLSLAGVTLGYVSLPGPPVEAVIALSIVFVAMEILRARQGNPSLTEKAPWLIAFVFGLLHGLGFADALSKFGLPQTEIPLALLFFNLGVEFGQLLFISIVLIAMISIRSIIPIFTKFRPPTWASWVLPYAIGSIAIFWIIQRVAVF